MSYPLLVMPAMFHWLSVHVNQGLNHVIDNYYLPLLSRSLRNPLGPICIGIAVVVASLGLVKAGVTPWDAFPKVDSNEISASITYPDGTPSTLTAATAEMIEHSILDLNQEWEQRGEPLVRTTRLAVGEVRDPSQLGPEGRATGSHVARVDVELVPAESRHISSQEIIAMWRERTGAVAGVESITFGEAAIGPGGTPIEFRLLGDKLHMDEIEAAVERCKEKLATYRGVVDIRDDSRQGKWEFQIRVNDKAKGLGVSLLQIAQTVRAAYFGEEAMRLQRGRHEVKLMVRYPEEERRKVESFDDIYVRALDGTEYPLSELADVTVKRGYSEINRIDQKRSIAIIADITPGVGNAADTVNDLKGTFMPGLLEQYRNVEVLWEGQQQQTSDSISSLGRGLLIALVAVFVLLTIEFKSYGQPIMIMLILPFGLVGALWGHAVMGLPLTLFSVFGLVALTGIVVNDSIVLVDAINHRVSDGLSVREAILDGCKRRFRPVLLTSVTTIAGLAPMLFETSFQAQFLIPLAVTIVFGLGCTTLVVLGMVPLQYQVYGRLFLRHLPQDDDELVLPGEARLKMAESQSTAGKGTNDYAGNWTTAARPVSNTSTEPIET
jgi:multidrug efflux pump subunit AcrB